MRIIIVASGAISIAVGGLLSFSIPYDPLYFQTVVVAIGLGALNLSLGLLITKSQGVKVASGPSDPIKMLVDRGVIGSTIYMIAFSQNKLVLKRLTSGSVTILAALLFAVLGYLTAGLIGVAVGGLTAFSLQEFITQRRRNAMSGNLLNASGKGDLEFMYNDLERVQLTRSRLRLFLENGIMGIVISRKYSPKMLPVLEEILPESKLREKK